MWTGTDSAVPVRHFVSFGTTGTDFAVPVRHFASFWATGTESHSPDALSCDGRRRGMAEFRGFGFAYIGCSWKGLSRFAKRGRNPEPGQPNLSRFVCRSIDPPPGHQPRIDRTLQCLAGMTISDDTRFLVRFATTSAPSQCENGIFSGVVSCRMRKILNQPPKRYIADSAELAGLRAMRSVVSECDSDNGRRQIAVSSH